MAPGPLILSKLAMLSKAVQNGVEMDGLALGVTGPTVYNWCRDLDIDDYMHPVAVDQGD